MIQASDQGIDTVFVGSTSMSPSKSRSGIFVKNGSNIHTAKDLIGKKIGVPSLNTLIHVIARRWLEIEGVDYNKVNFAEIGFQQMYDALNAGIVDGVERDRSVLRQARADRLCRRQSRCRACRRTR